MKTIFSISLAFLVLFSSIGMAKTTHFCMGHAMKSDFGFSPKHLDCGMAMDMDHEESDSKSEKSTQSCCENITEHLQVDEDVQLEKNHYSFNVVFAVALAQVFIFGLDSVETEQPTFALYTSPPLIQDFHVLFEQFLI
ncbi:hypothetical protein [Algoriphagus sp.]|uniref:HYC_CC_PP family protein n=1 Tax=Algoriphagus sp. TaxID=1872435 RepID=UPI00271E9384|nr:hypothetical protein [Algoriphagus sp.]MDO8966271.1 hypothetical protein [Algoriphagus sp.]MDP3201264.1 hypothetical protein [Algoriphagus sp.]